MKREREERLLERMVELASREIESETDALERPVRSGIVLGLPFTDDRLARLEAMARRERSLHRFACYLARGRFPGASA